MKDMFTRYSPKFILITFKQINSRISQKRKIFNIQNIQIRFLSCPSKCYCSLTTQHFLNLMQFFGNFDKITCWCPLPPKGRVPHYRDSCICICFFLTTTSVADPKAGGGAQKHKIYAVYYDFFLSLALKLATEFVRNTKF